MYRYKTPEMVSKVISCLGKDAIVYEFKHGYNHIIQAHWEIAPDRKTREVEIWLKRDLQQQFKGAGTTGRDEILRRIESYVTIKMKERIPPREVGTPKEIWALDSIV